MWYNQSAGTMKRIRVFERQCLRTCLRMHRSTHTDYRQYINNQSLYDRANIPRIENHIIALTREYFANSSQIDINPLINKITEIDTNYIEHCKSTGWIPPEAFILLDKQGYIQNENNVPIIHHWGCRHMNNKKIPNSIINIPTLKYSTAIPMRDKLDTSRANAKRYWWLSNNHKQIIEMKRRKKIQRKINKKNKQTPQ